MFLVTDGRDLQHFVKLCENVPRSFDLVCIEILLILYSLWHSTGMMVLIPSFGALQIFR